MFHCLTMTFSPDQLFQMFCSGMSLIWKLSSSGTAKEKDLI